MKFTNLPLGLKISVSALVAITALTLGVNFFIKNKNLQEDLDFFVAAGEQSLDSIRGDLKQTNFAGACELMQKAYERKLVSFFNIQLDGHTYCYNPKEKDAYTLREYKIFDQIVHDPKGSFDYKTIREGRFTASAGWLNASKANVLSIFIMKLPTVISLILLTVLAFSLIVFRETKPIKKLLKIFKKSGRVAEYYEASLAKATPEIRQLWRSAYEFEKTNEELKHEVQFVAQDAQNFLRKEIQRKKEKIPYRFFSSMLRFDMNNYTKTFLVDPEATQALILKISIQADELVHRYGGLHYAFGGDEFIVVFRDLESLDSRALALACMRDIFAKTTEVTLKASISHSENVLFELPNGLFLRGLNLILSQRYLTTVAVKDVNKLVVNSDDLDSFKNLANFSDPQLVSLKGIDGSTKISEMKNFTAIESIIEKKDFANLSYFRSDEDILYQLRCILRADLNTESKMQILANLKTFDVNDGPQKIAHEFAKCFRELDRHYTENKMLLSSLLIVAETAVPFSIWTQEMSQMLLNANCKADSRCNSAILKLLSIKGSREEFDRYAEQVLANAPGPDFRSMGNFLIAKAKNSLSDEILQECLRMLRSRNELEVATGIYVSSQIIQRQRRTDAVALSQFDMVPDLIAMIEKHRNHQDNMVRSRAALEFRELKLLERA